MRIVSWNLGHQTRPCAIKPGFRAAIQSLEPDLLILNEYVHDETRRKSMLDELVSCGLSHWRVSENLPRYPHGMSGPSKMNNQVLIAGKSSLALGNLRGPDTFDGGGESNFLHVRPSGIPMEVVGIRVPDYEKRTLADYWDALMALIRSVANRPISFFGDFNADPDQSSHLGGPLLAKLRDEGWHVPSPSGLWSFKSGTRIDHVVASSLLRCPSASYVIERNGITLGGSRATAVSDHAPIVVDFPPAPVSA